MSLFRIAALLGCLLICDAPAVAEWATLKGKFELGIGPIPPVPRLKLHAGMKVCGQQSLMNEQLVINQRNRGIRDVVIWAVGPRRVHPDYSKDQEPVVVDNRNCRFEPHVVCLPTTRTLRIKNSDAFAHNYFVPFFTNDSINRLVPSKKFVDIQLTKREVAPVSVTCGVHPWMHGVLLVQEHPYMVSTDDDGQFALKNLPAGPLLLQVWHKKTGWMKSVSIDGKKTSWKRGRYSIKLLEDQFHTYSIPLDAFKKKT